MRETEGNRNHHRSTVVKIGGKPWALDQETKGKDERHSFCGEDIKRKKVQNLKEIDGHTWLVNGFGTPIKRLRKKVKIGIELRRGKLESDATRLRWKIGEKRRSKKVKRQAPEFALPPTLLLPSGSEKIGQLGTELNSLWDDGTMNEHQDITESTAETSGHDEEDFEDDVEDARDLRLSEANERNKLLEEELKRTKEEMLFVADQVKKEKAKNGEMMMEISKLKAQAQESNRALSHLMEKFTDLASSIEEKDQKLIESKQETVTMHKKMEIIVGGLNRDTIDPIVGWFMERVLREKKEVEERYVYEKEANGVRVSSLEDMIRTLETMNLELNRKVVMYRKAGQKLEGFARNRCLTAASRDKQ